MTRSLYGILTGFLLLPGFATAQQSERTLEELKAEVIARAERNAYPLIGLKAAEVREAVASLRSTDRDEWAAVWTPLGDRYMREKDYRQAWLYYSFARWPVPNSAGKQRAYEKALDAYLALAREMDPPLEVLRVPVEAGEVVAYLRLPKGASAQAPVALAVAIAGLDSRKEEMVERFSPLLAQGIGVLALDSPGTGQSPVKAVPGAEATLVRAIDAALKRPQVDRKRLAAYGGSFGGYWATILAATEAPRLRAVVVQSPPIHETFDPQRTADIARNREYLFDYLPAQLFTFGASSMAELEAARAKLSLKTRGLLDRAMPPMLVIGGALDTQVPMADIELLLKSGDTPKDSWIHPRGGHMGRDARQWPDPVIFRRVTMPWLLRALQADS
jgi:pimeloyl-ACP methyl ester carboxylesterase